MFRDRPLTWLFVIATICVDLVLGAVQSDSDTYEIIQVGCLWGQVAALAIWAVRGHMHRLLRSSCLVLGTGLWVRFVFPEEDRPATVFFYAAIIFSFTLFVEVMRNMRRNGESDIERRKRLQVPLIEFFGWTIIVAIVSFGCRYMDFKVLFEGTANELALALLSGFSVPFLLILFIRNDLRDLSAIKALILIGAVLALEWNVGYFIITMQAAYLIAWMTVITLDNISEEAAKTNSSPEETPPATKKPKLFNPQD